MNHKCKDDCPLCEKMIDELEYQKLAEKIEPKPLKKDGLWNRGNPDSRYYDGI